MIFANLSNVWGKILLEFGLYLLIKMVGNVMYPDDESTGILSLPISSYCLEKTSPDWSFCNSTRMFIFSLSVLMSFTMAWHVPWVANGGVDLKIWRLAANILNKQSWTADQEWSSSLGVWREANNLTL